MTMLKPLEDFVTVVDRAKKICLHSNPKNF